MKKIALVCSVIIIFALLLPAQDYKGKGRVGGIVTAGYRVGPKDLVEIKVFEVPELNGERRIDADGTVDLPLLGKVKIEGLTDTDMIDGYSAAVRESVAKSTTLGRLGQPRDIADVVAFLASEEGRWITGQMVVANGGSNP